MSNTQDLPSKMNNERMANESQHLQSRKADPVEYAEGTDKKTGRFLPGNKLGKGRPKGSRNKLNQQMLDRVADKSESGLSPEEIIMGIMQDATMPPELRFKAASKIMDMVHPKAQSIELIVDEKDSMSKSQMEDRIKQLVTKHKLGEDDAE